jgi:transposase
MNMVMSCPLGGQDKLFMVIRVKIYKKSKRFANGKVYINGIEGFWSYAKGRLLKFHGLSPKTFKYYLKKLEFRYNNRNENLFDKIVEAVRGGMN